MTLPSISYLAEYLEHEWFEDDDFPWNKSTCLAVVCYVIKKKHGSTSPIIRRLESVAKQYLTEVDDGMAKHRMHLFSRLFVNSFIPKARIHFTVPELDHLSDMDRNLQRNEILAGFLDFLVQILHREANVGLAGKIRYAPLKKALLFLLAVLGDKPFHFNTQYPVLKEQVIDLLVEFETLANKVGWFISSRIFSIRLVKDNTFYAKRNALIKRFKILNKKIKQHCINFSKLPIHDVPRSNIVDSFFIIYSLVDDLDNFSSPEIKDQIEMLRDELITSRVVFEFIETRQVDSATKEPLVQIRDLAYEAEYLINSHVVGNIHAWYLDLRLPFITQEIKLSRERLQQIKEMTPSEVMMHGGETSDPTPAPAVDDNYFVELGDKTTERILLDLVGKSKSHDRQIISISGMPGLGKTTIANKLYHLVSNNFDRRAWCVVSQTYNVRSLLINILTNVDLELKKEEIMKQSDEVLGDHIYKSLWKRRYLIVLDDVWHSTAWDDLKRYLPDNGNGSRVMLTTRIMDAAPHGSKNHPLPLFSKHQCWDLLEKKMFRGESCPWELLSIGEQIAAKCSGIPLAVNVIAGILARLKRDGDAWKRVENKLETFLLDDPGDYRKILELSYEHLPHYMKPCFLYFAAFPEDVEISVNKLAWRWMAEGFITKSEKKSQEQVAKEYILELMNRSLVIPGRTSAGGGIKTCRIHDRLRDICLTKANEENFFNCNNELATYEKHQRSYLSSTSDTDSRPFGLHCRSLIGGLPDRSSCFQTRAILKVLDIRPGKFQIYEGTSFVLPIQLRYLGVNYLTEIMVAKLNNLETINVVNSSLIKVPSTILRMKKLKHLLIRKAAIFEDDGYISEMTNLRTLLHVYIEEKPDEAILRNSPHLHTLKYRVGGKTIFPDLSFLKELETLKIVFEVGRSIVGGRNVSDLNFPSTIKNLCLVFTYMPHEKMSVLGKLPNLCVLKLEDISFRRHTWETLDDEFGKLKFLKIKQSYLTHWTTCSKPFPKLEHLVLENLVDLKEIPSDIGNIDTLNRIDVIRCSMHTCKSALQIEQGQCDDGNEDFQVNITTNYWTKEELTTLYKEKMECAKNALVMESDSSDIYELSSIFCSRERDFLVRNTGEQVKVNSLKGKVVGIYFSSSELESCQLFTRKLMKLYNGMKKYGHFEIVLVSHDIDDGDPFTANFSKLPWLAIPRNDLDNTKMKLNELFEVRRLPHLVIMDENKKILTEGVKIVEEGSELEFIPKIKLEEDEKERIKESEEKGDEDKRNESLESLLVSKTRDYVIDNHWKKVQVSNLVGKTTMLLFAENGVPQCTNFIRKLVNVYQESNEKYNNCVEVILVSICIDQFHFDEFFATMPWLALPFGDDRAYALRMLYMVKAIPMVVVIGPNGKTVTVDGFRLILCYGAEAYPFTSRRVKEIESENDSMEKFWPNKIKVEVHDHELRLSRHKSYYACGRCGEDGCNWQYFCRNCEFTLHPRCALGDDYNAEEAWPKKVMKKVHELKGTDEMAKLWPDKMNLDVHEHELRLIKTIHDYFCDECGEGGCDWTYYCANCDFDLHPMCALGDDYMAQMVESSTKKDPEEEEEATRNYSLESLLITQSRDFVINSAGEKIRLSNLVGKTTVLFFAAHWCPPCQFVLPEMVQRYQENNETEKNNVEVIFISSDEDQLSFDKFFAMMPWLALPFGDYRIKSMSRFFKVKAIPMLITIKPTGKAVESKGWELTSYPGAEAYPFTYEWMQFQAKAQKMVIFWPKKVTESLHCHELCLVKQILYDCDYCHEVGCSWSYKCGVCVFNLHPNCALVDNK